MELHLQTSSPVSLEAEFPLMHLRVLESLAVSDQVLNYRQLGSSAGAALATGHHLLEAPTWVLPMDVSHPCPWGQLCRAQDCPL